MKVLVFIMLLPLLSACQDSVDIAIRNGKVIDGTGNAWHYSDIAIDKGKIVMTGKLDDVKARRNIDATGLLVTPGFIDVHTHIEGDEVENPEATNFIYDGVT